MPLSDNQTESQTDPIICVICVGNKLMLDDGLGCAVYEELMSSYIFPSNVELLDVGCMSLDMLEKVNTSDVIITVDAVDSTGEPVGTIFEFAPDDMQVKSGATASLHELTLADLFEAATLLGYKSDGICLGMQVENLSPSHAAIGLTPVVVKRLPMLVECVLAKLLTIGIEVYSLSSKMPVTPGWKHEPTKDYSYQE